MSVRTRADLDQLPAYVAGKSVPGAIKLASNEVSGGPLPGVRETVATAACEVHRYPDIAVGRLTEVLAERFGVDTGRVAVGCGSVALCQQIVQATCNGPEDEVLFPWRSFEAYPIITRIAGATPVTVPVTDAHALDLEAMRAAITPNTRVVFVCTPNNPTGTVLHRAELERFLDAVPTDTVVILDEAYFEFVTDPDAPDGMDLLRGRDNVVSMRTFSKAYGLAGARVGYAVGPAKIIEALRKVCIPFSVNALAQAAALASLDAEDELKVRCAEIAEERDRVRSGLLDLGFEVAESQANFVWLPLGDTAQAFNDHCMANKGRGAHVRRDGVRVTIGKPDENDAFLAAAKSYRP